MLPCGMSCSKNTSSVILPESPAVIDDWLGHSPQPLKSQLNLPEAVISEVQH